MNSSPPTPEANQPSLSQHVHERFQTLVSTGANDDETWRRRCETAQQVGEWCDEPIQQYASFSAHGDSVARLPALDWNSHFRKAYSLLLWVRVRTDDAGPVRPVAPAPTTATEPPAGDAVLRAGGAAAAAEHHENDSNEALWYRFYNSANDIGVQVSSSHEWKFQENGSTINKVSCLISASTFLGNNSTAPSLPRTTTATKLEFTLNTWHLLSFTHLFPYLQRPTWTVSLDGQTLSTQDLPYPVLENRPTAGIMHDNRLVQNLVSAGFHNSHRPAKEEEEQRRLVLDLASVALYGVAVPPTCCALASEAGVATSLQQGGRILPTLVPVANWSKGSSLEDGGGAPKVGVPLSVHSAALEVQRLSRHVVFCATAVDARRQGSDAQPRWIWSMPQQAGSTSQTPRVGLIQPSAATSSSNSLDDHGDSMQPTLVISGPGVRVHCTGLTNVSNPPPLPSKGETPFLSVVMAEQQVLVAAVLPLFLSLCPPGYWVDRQTELAEKSWKQLYSLYRNDAEYAASLIRLLATALRNGGARFHEDCLQNGILHCLASSLRISLLRAQKAGITKAASWAQFQKQRPKNIDDQMLRERTSRTTTTSVSTAPGSPSFVPLAIVEAVLGLLDACCGPPSPAMDQLYPAQQVRRTSDLALTAVFGLALDMDLWGGNVTAAARVLNCLADRYGGMDVTYGYILRSQLSVQYLLDVLRLHLERQQQSRETDASTSPDLDLVAQAASRLLQAMLFSSLSNRKRISQAENDVAACVGALTDSVLGSVGAHVILHGFVGLLAWCEVLPLEVVLESSRETEEGGDTDSMPSLHHHNADENHKMQVASRLGRNLLMAQFHDVVAPMILSRTAFSGLATPKSSSSSRDRTSDDCYSGSLTWKHHWRLTLLLFSWVASVAGPDGLKAAKSSGDLLLASGLAGSLTGVLDHASKVLISSLFLPPPGMALMIGSTFRNEWSYTDLLSDRLQICVPLLPGLVAALLSTPSDRSFNAGDSFMTSQSAVALAELMTAAGGAFHRVFGGVVHSTDGATRRQMNDRREGRSETIKAAKTFVPHLVVVALLLNRRADSSTTRPIGEPRTVKVLPSCVPPDTRRRTDSDSWVDVKSVDESLIDEIVVTASLDESNVSSEEQAALLQSCQISAMNTASGLISNAMMVGGSGTTVSLWQNVLVTFGESAVQLEKLKGTDSRSDLQRLSQTVLCQLVARVLVKILRGQNFWEVWNFETSTAVSRLCLMLEEKSLLENPVGTSAPGESLHFSDDQIVLLCVLLDVMAYGREAAGWCQLSLPTVPGDEKSKAALGSPGDISAASKMLLPVLQPCLRIALGCIDTLSSSDRIWRQGNAAAQSDTDKMSTASTDELLLKHLLSEIDSTLTAAIVGLSFSSARAVALTALATLRRAIISFLGRMDEDAAGQCRALFCKVVEEMRVRYEGERRLRETALFDAYEDDSHHASRKAAEESQAVERIMLGGDLVGTGTDEQVDSSQDRSEEITFDSENEAAHLIPVKNRDDFVMFHENLADQGQIEFDPNRQSLKLGYAEYEGLGAALEKCKIDSGVGDAVSAEHLDSCLSTLAPFLDACDEKLARDVQETELVDLFDTNMQLSTVSEHNVGGSSDHNFRNTSTDSQSAADAMSSFFEFAAVEKSRLHEVSAGFLTSYRYSRISYTDRFCWARYMDFAPLDAEIMWERGTPDGNRDIRSRLPTLSCYPQFRQFIPKYLDHSGAVLPLETSPAELLDESEGHRRASSTPKEIDAFTKSLLDAGNLEIVDVTKQEIVQDEEPELVRRNSMDDDEFFGQGVGESDRLDPSLHDKDESPKVEEEETADSMVDTDEASPTEDTAQSKESSTLVGDVVFKGSHSITSSSFATPPDNASSSLSIMQSAAAASIELSLDNCLHVRAEGSRSCSLLLTSAHLILEYDDDSEGFFDGELMAIQEEADRQRMASEVGAATDQNSGEVSLKRVEHRQREIAELRPKSIRWNLSEVSHVYLRRYRLRDSALELFVIPTGGTSFGGLGLFSPLSSLFLDFGPGREGNTRRDDAAFAIMRRAPPQAIKQWPDRSEQFLHDQLSRLTLGWVEGRITNFDYLLHLNMLSGRSYNDICQYPVFPWVLADYSSEEIPDLSDKNNFRDLTKPVGALNPDRLADFIERFNSFADPSIPPFMYGSHYSTSAGVVLHFLVRLHPFAGLHRQLQGGHFDVADRLFHSIPRTWGMVTGSSAAEVKELTPEFYCNPSFLRNMNKFKLGTSQDGDVLGDVLLPPWAKDSPEKFVEVMRAALESDRCSEMLPDWIDLIFGRKQQGPEAVKANNVFFYLTYYGSVDVALIEDEGLRQATELQIAHFGQCPMRIFSRPHLRRLPRSYHKLSFFQLISAHSQRQTPSPKADASKEGDAPSDLPEPPRRRSAFGELMFLPFLFAPLSHWVHLDAPPPGPHAALIAVRFAGIDRCLAIDAKGIFHTFRWAWRTEEASELDRTEFENRDFDSGCFVAQRELLRFRTVPSLMHSVPTGQVPAVAISKTLFAGRSVLLVLSDGDGLGSLGMQFVDPAKGSIRGEVLLPSVHSAMITCIATDPVGTAAGHGGVGGELAIVGSADGNASLWRFMSSHYLPLRPRVRLQGHGGHKVSAVALCSTIHMAATLSTDKLCLYSIGNGNLVRSWGPPDDPMDLPSSDDTKATTLFADTPALALTVQGFVVTVCETTFRSSSGEFRTVASLHLFTVEGVSLGSKPLEKWRGLPRKILASPDGTAVMVCCGRGITVHRVSACHPLHIIDEFQITETEDLSDAQSIPAAFDLDLGPSLNRPVVAAAACSKGALRLHALPGIGAWSERHKSSGLGQSVGSALAKPAQRIKTAMRDGLGIGKQLAGMGRDLGREVSSDVKERGVGGFVGGLFRKNTGGSTG